VDTLIFGLILATAGAVIRTGRRRDLILGASICLVAALLLFRHHVTSPLDLNF
jgi:hypothetical protein